VSFEFALTVIVWLVLALGASWLALRLGKKIGDWLEDHQWRL
jgi:hypothetical protein